MIIIISIGSLLRKNSDPPVDLTHQKQFPEIASDYNINLNLI